ncbi:TasA family protein [Bacillus nitroreducens]
MLSKKKMATIAATGMVTVGLLVGGASFALFTDTEANSGNNFKAGTLTLDSHRHDVPITGPMFYVNSDDAGRMGTGLWAPLDSHSRSMFIKNTGSLDGELTRIFASSASGDEAAMFAEQALVSVMVYETGGVALDENAHMALNKAASDYFNREINATGFGSDFRKELARGIQYAEAFIRQVALDFKYSVNVDGTPVNVSVTDVYVGSLKDMYSSAGVGPTKIVLPAGQALELGFTVTLLDDKNQTFDNNDIKDISPVYEFKTVFSQEQ